VSCIHFNVKDEIGRRNRATEQIALRLRASRGSQQRKLLFGFDPFCNRDNVEASSEVRHGAHNRGAGFHLSHFAYKRPVDLDPIEPEQPEVAQRRVTGSKIVKRDRYPERPMLRKPLPKSASFAAGARTLD
jgi:hypothetical protein